MLKNLLTVLYYTSNRERPEFEEKIIKNLLMQCGDLPIVSVSQKPLVLGKNICVGNVGLSYFNAWRQILIGVKEVKTPYIIFAESDFLYPREYFTFIPPKKGLYFYNNIYIVYKDASISGSYRKKLLSDGAQICDKDLLMKEFERLFKGRPDWNNSQKNHYDDSPFGREDFPFEYFSGNTPCISFKTGNGVQKYASVLSGPGTRKLMLPFWGHISTLRAEYFSNETSLSISMENESR